MHQLTPYLKPTGSVSQQSLALHFNMNELHNARFLVDGQEIEYGYSLNDLGLGVRISRFSEGYFTELRDVETKAYLFWTALSWNRGPEFLAISADFTPRPTADDTLNILILNERRLEFNHSRNLESKTGETKTSDYEASLRKICQGPTHLLWTAHPDKDGPMRRFKDVGNREDGGVKFRFDSYGYVLFCIDKKSNVHVWQRNDTQSMVRFVIMRYVRRELDVIWEIRKDGITRHG